MDELLMLVILVVATAVLARVAAHFFRVEVPLGWPLGRESRERFWRDAMPWPHGVQEDAEIAWHVPRAESATGSVPDRGGDQPSDRPIPPTQPQRRLTGR